jgi:hypothetical protein
VLNMPSSVLELLLEVMEVMLVLSNSIGISPEVKVAQICAGVRIGDGGVREESARSAEEEDLTWQERVDWCSRTLSLARLGSESIVRNRDTSTGLMSTGRISMNQMADSLLDSCLWLLASGPSNQLRNLHPPKKIHRCCACRMVGPLR